MPRRNPPLWKLNYTTLRAEPTQTCGAVGKTCQQEMQDVTATGTLRIGGLEETRSEVTGIVVHSALL